MTFLLLTLANLKVSGSKKMDDSSSEGSVDEEEILRHDEAKKKVQSETYPKLFINLRGKQFITDNVCH